MNQVISCRYLQKIYKKFKGPHFAGLFFMFVTIFFVGRAEGQGWRQSPSSFCCDCKTRSFQIRVVVHEAPDISRGRGTSASSPVPAWSSVPLVLPLSPVESILSDHNLSFHDHLWLQDLSPTESHARLSRMLDERVLGVAQSMQELISKIETDKKFRKKVRKLSEVGFYKKTKCPHGKKVCALKHFALHQREEANRVLEERKAEAARQKRVADWLSKGETLGEMEVSRESLPGDIQNFEEIFRAHEYYEHVRAYPASGGMVALGKQLLVQYKYDVKYNTGNGGVVLRKRLAACIETVQDGGKGTALDQNLHGEIIEISTDGAMLKEAFGENELVEALAEVVVNSAGVALVCKREKEYEEGYLLVDFARDVVRVGKKTGMVMLSGVAGAAAGVVTVATFPVQLAARLAVSPVETTVGLASGVSGLVSRVLQASWLSVTKPAEFKDRMSEKLAVLERQLRRMSANEKAYEISKLMMEMLFPVASVKLNLIKKFGQLTKSVGRAMNVQAVSPMTAAMMHGYETLRCASRSWGDFYLEKAATFLRKKRANFEGFKVVDGTIAEVGTHLSLAEKVEWFNKTTFAMLKNNLTMKEGKWSWHAMKHVTTGEFEKGIGLLRGGMHSKKFFEKWRRAMGASESEFAMTYAANGITEVRVPKRFCFGNRKARKTFWPKEFTPLDVIEACGELLSSSKKVCVKRKSDRIVYKGMVSKSMNIKVVLDGEGKIITVYPLFG